MIEEIFQHTSWQEWLGVIFGICQVLLARQNNPNTYLFGIGSILLSMVVLFTAKLYAEMALSSYYLVMSIYGWLFWKFGRQKQEAPIAYSTKRDWGIVVGIVVLAFTIFYYFLTHLTDSDVPIWDSAVSAFAWAGMWLMAKRRIENWVLLNISNLLAIPLLWHKSLYLFAFLTAFLFVVAVTAFFKWRKIIKNQPYVTE